MVDDVVIILDFAAGNYFALAPELKPAWLALAHSERVLDDESGERLIAEAQSAGWLADNAMGSVARKAAKSSPGAVRRASRMGAATRLLRARLGLKCFGLARTYSWARSIAETAPNSASASLDTALELFAAAEALLPSMLGEHDCLPRSLALFGFLRGLGLPAKHVIGVRRFPFSAHAWVEVGGRVLLGGPSHGATVRSGATASDPAPFTPIATLA